MSFVDAKFSKWGGVATAVFSQSLAKRFARVMLAAVLAASFLPVAAFADEGGAVGDSVGNEAVDQPATTEPEAPEESEAPAEFGQPAETESGDSADQPAEEPQDIPLLLSTEDGSDDGQESTTYISYGDARAFTSSPRSEYNWSYIRGIDGGDITISYIDHYTDHDRVSVMGTQVGHVTLVVSGGDVSEERFEIEITKRNVTVRSTNVDKFYDGKPLTCAIAVDPDFAMFDDVDCIPNSSRTNVGTTNNVTFEIKFNKGSPNSYNITKFETGKIEIRPRVVTLTSASGSKEYDGKPLTNHKVTVGEAAWDTGWVDGQGATYSFTGSQKIVGSSENAFECIPNEGTNLDNYQIKKTYGTLTVTDRSEKYQITLTPNSKSVTYDGTEKSVSGFETLEFKINGQTFYVSGVEASATGTDAGEYPVTESGQAVVTDVDGNDVTDQFIVNIDDAKLTIVKDDSAPVDPDKPSADTPSKTTGKTTATKATAAKPASKSARTGDGIALYAMGICAVAIVAGAVAFVARRKRNSDK